MKRNVYAKLNQGMDSFLRVAMTLRRKELCVEQISMSQEESGILGSVLSLPNILQHRSVTWL